MIQMYKKISKQAAQVAIRFKKTIFFAVIVLLSYSVSAQNNPTVQIKIDRPTIQQVLNEIEKQTGYRIAHSTQLNTSVKITIPQNPTKLSDIMGFVLKGSGMSYSISNNLIIIQKGKTAVAQGPKQKNVSTQPQINNNPANNEYTQKVGGQVMLKEASKLIANADVTLVGKITYVTTTDFLGQFKFPKIPIGEYKLVVSHLDYSSIKQDVEVVRGNDVNLALYIESSPRGLIEIPEIKEKYYVKQVGLEPLIMSIEPYMKQNTPKFAIKTNLVYDALTNINLGFEFRLSDHLTLDIPVNYNPWVFADNKRLNNILIQPELRWWINEPFNGHFFGIHTHYAHYNTANISLPFGLYPQWKDSRYQGDLYGAGLSYGYQWFLSKRLNLEFTLGFGYFYAKYDRFECHTCGEPQGRETKHYFGPTKAGLSLVYIIK